MDVFVQFHPQSSIFLIIIFGIHVMLDLLTWLVQLQLFILIVISSHTPTNNNVLYQVMLACVNIYTSNDFEYAMLFQRILKFHHKEHIPI